MKKIFLAGLAAFFLQSFAIRAANFTTSVTQAAGADWNAAIWQPGPVSPTAGNTYEAISNGTAFGNGTANTRVRNPAVTGIQTFPGDSLTLNLNTELRLKGVNGTIADFPGVAGNPGLILNGGVINTGDSGVVYGLSGRIQVQQPSIFDFGDPGGGAVSPTRGINITGILSGSAGLTLEVGGITTPLNILSVNNPFSGNWTINSGYLKGSAAGSLGNGTNSFTFNVTNPGTTNPSGALFDTDYDLVTTGTLVLGPAVGSTHAVFRLDQNDRFNGVTIEGTSLAPGVYTAAQLLVQFPNNFDPLSTGTLTIVPEPASLGLVLSGLAFITVRRNRREELTGTY